MFLYSCLLYASILKFLKVYTHTKMWSTTIFWIRLDFMKKTANNKYLIIVSIAHQTYTFDLTVNYKHTTNEKSGR